MNSGALELIFNVNNARHENKNVDTKDTCIKLEKNRKKKQYSSSRILGLCGINFSSSIIPLNIDASFLDTLYLNP